MSNWDDKPLTTALTGVETLPVNQAGVTKHTTIDLIKAYIGAAYEAVGSIATAIAAHLAAYAHSDIAHANRAALDLVSGKNTGDQDLSGFVNQTALTNIAGLNAGAAAPSTPVPNQFWVDTSHVPPLIMQRTGDNSAWVSLYTLSSAGLGFHDDIHIKGITVGTGGSITTNTVIGLSTFYSNTTGEGNTAIGRDVLGLNTSGSFNAAVGGNALGYNETGSYNVALGAAAGEFWGNSYSSNVAPQGCTFIGQYTRSSAPGNTNEIVIGYDTLGSGSNTATLGNDSIVKTILKGTLKLGTVPAVHADNADALAAGHVAGEIYRTATGVVMVVY